MNDMQRLLRERGSIEVRCEVCHYYIPRLDDLDRHGKDCRVAAKESSPMELASFLITAFFLGFSRGREVLRKKFCSGLHNDFG